MLAGPLVFTPKGQSYWFEGEIAVGEIVRGVVPPPPFVASRQDVLYLSGPLAA